MDDELLRKIERLEAQVEALTSEHIPKVDRASKRRDRRQVFSGLGLFAIALLIAGTMSASALSGSNTVLSDDIKDGQVHGADINADAVTGAKVKDGTLTGADVKESTLALSCPSGMSLAGGVCYGALNNPGATWYAALTACAGDDLRLPTVAEGQVVEAVKKDFIGIWTDNFFYQGTAEKARIAAEIPGFTAASDAWPYRCVTTVGARH